MPFQQNMINSIIEECRAHGTEQPWIEFKVNKHDHFLLGEYISALANSAALFGRSCAFMIWGIDDKNHDYVGTSFDPKTEKEGNQGIELWLATQLEPQVQFYFYKTIINDKNIVLLEISPALSSPVKFRGVDYIRIDSNKKKLKDFPDTERELWAVFTKRPFEVLTAMDDVPAALVMRLLDYAAYFEMLSLELPTNPDGVIEALRKDGMILQSETGNYNITNMGAVLFARRISDFPSLERKAIRVIKYNGKDRMAPASKEQVGGKGYANGFEGLIEFINNLLPINEVIGQALRKDVPMYPELAVRELVANAIIHQNFFLQGTSPTIEIFDNRMEITNPGTPLIDKERFLDSPPISRNERLASFMRRVGVCEERGSGFDKVVFETEFYQLPAPEIEVYENHTKITLFAHISFSQMTREDRQRACYLHACLKRVKREYMTNSSLRERFKVDAKNSSAISRVLRDTCHTGLIKLTEDSTGDKNRKYVPFWA